MARYQDMPAVVAAAVVVEGVLHVICGNGAHHAWDAQVGHWAECAPVPESFVGRKKTAEEHKKLMEETEREYELRLEAERSEQLKKSLSVVIREMVAKQGDAGASITNICANYGAWAWRWSAKKHGRAVLEKEIGKLLESGLLEKRTGPRNLPVFFLVED